MMRTCAGFGDTSSSTVQPSNPALFRRSWMAACRADRLAIRALRSSTSNWSDSSSVAIVVMSNLPSRAYCFEKASAPALLKTS